MKEKHYKFTVCAIASPLEANYIDEWIKYHKAIGVEAFCIATNDWEWKNSYEDVYIVRIDGRAAQCPYYTRFVQTMSQIVDWAAFIDIDEFIRLGDKHRTVLDLVEEFQHCDSISLSWRLFGSNGLHFDNDYSVLKRFTKRQHDFNIHVKSILNLAKLRSFGDQRRTVFMNPHFACRDSIYTLQQYTVDRRQIVGPYDNAANYKLKDNDTWLAHYFCKTPEEWKLKQARGRVDVPANSGMVYRKDEEFSQHDFNDVEDTSLRDVLCKDNN